MAWTDSKWKRDADKSIKAGRKIHFVQESETRSTDVAKIIEECESSGWVLDHFDVSRVYVPGDEKARRTEDKQGKMQGWYYLLFRRGADSKASES